MYICSRPGIFYYFTNIPEIYVLPYWTGVYGVSPIVSTHMLAWSLLIHPGPNQAYMSGTLPSTSIPTHKTAKSSLVSQLFPSTRIWKTGRYRYSNARPSTTRHMLCFQKRRWKTFMTMSTGSRTTYPLQPG